MSPAVADHPLLAPGPALRCSRCPTCALVAFPAERYGCERCGTLPDTMAHVEVAPTGEVRSAALVHRHHDAALPVPFVVVVVALDGGPVLKGVLVAGAEAPAIGVRVHGVSTGGDFRFEVD